MRVKLARRFQRSFKQAPRRVRKDFAKQVDFLLENIKHPSLRTKKYDAVRNIWQARVNRDWRFYFVKKNDTYVCIDPSPLKH